MNAPLPGAPQLQRREDGALWLEDVRLSDLARQYGTPLYVYSQGAMVDAAQAYQRALAGHPHRLCYAVKANSNLAVLRLFAQLGLGFDIVSLGELARVLAAGANASSVVYSGVGKRPDEMRAALQAGVYAFNVESEAELQQLSDVASACGLTARISLRVNPDVDAGTHPYISTGLKSNKFGIAHDRALAAYRRASALPGLQVAGIDCHIGSQITDIAPYLDALDRLLDLTEQLEADGIAVHHLDLGGGLGIRYADEQPPEAGQLVQAVRQRLLQRGHGQRLLMMEPGRSLVGNAGVLLTEVLVLKPRTDADSGRNFCVVDAAMNDLVRPAMYEAWMAIEPCQQRLDSTQLAQRWDVVGPVCESGDWLGRDRLLAPQQGDLLAVLSAGAYGMTMASHYNTRPRAAEVMVDGAQSRLIRRRETVDDLLRHEQL